MKRFNHIREKTKSFYDYMGDGRFDKERIKGKDKKELKRYTRRFYNREANIQIEEVN